MHDPPQRVVVVQQGSGCGGCLSGIGMGLGLGCVLLIVLAVVGGAIALVIAAAQSQPGVLPPPG